MRSKITLIPVLYLALAAGAANAQQLLPAGPADLAADSLVAAPALKGLAVPRDAVALSWPLAADAALDAAEPFVARSREYFVDVTADDLRRGVDLHTTGPGALVRLNPAAADGATFSDKAAIAPESLVLTDPAGTSWGGGSGMDQMVGPSELKAAGAPFVEGTSAFRLREELGAGTFTVRAEGLGAAAAERYVVHVFDRQSPWELVLRTTETDYLHGQTLTVEASVEGATPGAARRTLRLRSIDGYVTSPAGRAWPLSFAWAGGGLYRATLELDALEAPAPGLWQVEAAAHALLPGLTLRRAGHTAFGCAVPSARLSGGARIDSAADRIGVRLGVEAASAGRYEARGVLWGTAGDGTLRPAGIAHSAAWIEAGTGSLELAFGREVLDGKGLGAPYEVRDLRLVDQAAMGLLHRQARALTID